MKNVKNLSAFVSTSKMGREIEKVLVTPDKVVATDSFKLIEVSGPTGVPKPVLVGLPKGVKSFDHIETKEVGQEINSPHHVGKIMTKGATYEVGNVEEDGRYPKYTQVIPTEEPVFSIKLSPDHLKEICIALSENQLRGRNGNQNAGMLLEFYDAEKPVKITGENVLALIMPIKNL